jgi:molybdenum cofactor cytidylyltransferase
MIAAIVPAAGRSERMGRPKLLLPIGGTSVIARVIAALRDGGADPILVVVPTVAIAGAEALAAAAGQAGASVVVADPPPPDMRASVERGLDRLGRQPAPATLLIAPGDSPGITAGLVARLIARARSEPRAILIPSSHGRRGHPIALPWSLAAEIRGLPHDVGINALVKRHADRVVELDVAHPDSIADLDTPDDYRRWVAGPDPVRGGMDARRERGHD